MSPRPGHDPSHHRCHQRRSIRTKEERMGAGPRRPGSACCLARVRTAKPTRAELVGPGTSAVFRRLPRHSHLESTSDTIGRLSHYCTAGFAFIGVPEWWSTRRRGDGVAVSTSEILALSTYRDAAPVPGKGRWPRRRPPRQLRIGSFECLLFWFATAATLPRLEKGPILRAMNSCCAIAEELNYPPDPPGAPDVSGDSSIPDA
jgi:hypothetical protein